MPATFQPARPARPAHAPTPPVVPIVIAAQKARRSRPGSQATTAPALGNPALAAAIAISEGTVQASPVPSLKPPPTLFPPQPLFPTQQPQPQPQLPTAAFAPLASVPPPPPPRSPALAPSPATVAASAAAASAALGLTPPHVTAIRPVVVPPPSLSRWAAFEKIGLVAEKLDPRVLSKYVVNVYRLLGFGILTIIVVVLVGYITTTAFFYMSDRWVVPMALSPTDDKVLALQGQLAEHQNQRDQTASMLDDAERNIAVQQAFQGEFARAVQSDLEGRKAALAKMHQLANAAASTRISIRKSNDAFATASSQRMAQEYRAGLIDRTSMLSGKFQLAQISNTDLSLVERQTEYETRAADLEAQTRSLEALLANKVSGDPMSYDVLKIKQEYEMSRLATQKAIETRDTLKTALARQDALLVQLKQTSYLRAMADHAQVAYVPYGNLDNVTKGTTLYGCKLGMIFCHKVGTVLEVLPGEVLFKHPQRDKMLRGQMIELQLTDGPAATDDVLFLGRKPLLL